MVRATKLRYSVSARIENLKQYLYSYSIALLFLKQCSIFEQDNSSNQKSEVSNFLKVQINQDIDVWYNIHNRFQQVLNDHFKLFFESCYSILNVEFYGQPISVFESYFFKFKTLITVTFPWNTAWSDEGHRASQRQRSLDPTSFS